MAELRLARARDADEFERLAFPFLAAREAEHNLLFGIVAGVRSGGYTTAPYFAVVRSGDRVVAAALRTPPFNLVLSMIDDPAALDLLAEDAERTWLDLPGVLGMKEDAAAFAALWTARTGRATTLRTRERVFRLARVIPPANVEGLIRLAQPADRETVATWWMDFLAEAIPHQPRSLANAETAADRIIARVGGRAMYLWVVDGTTVSMTGVGAVTPNGSRVGPVYTPPERRGRGYASALVAAASQLQLDAGRRYCFLFTDLANPTSNKIYRAIGYEAVCDVDEHQFDGAPTAT
jgi:predicted GNAT family acetyltransferase